MLFLFLALWRSVHRFEYMLILSLSLCTFFCISLFAYIYLSFQMAYYMRLCRLTVCLFHPSPLSHSTKERTELHDAAERGDMEAVRTLLLTAISINSRTEDVCLSITNYICNSVVKYFYPPVYLIATPVFGQQKRPHRSKIGFSMMS